MLNQCQVQATAIILGIALIWRLSWTMPFLIANSIVGMAYMILEHESLRKTGSACFGYQMRIRLLPNILLNLVTHILLPLHLLTQLDDTPLDWKRTIAIEIIGLCLIDLNAVYPSQNTLKYYILSHILILTASHCFLCQRS